MNYVEVYQALNTILTDKGGKVSTMAQQAGGWEGWLQGELSAYWEEGKVYREQNAWGDRRAIDLWFPDTRFGVELKCFGLNRAYKEGHIFSDTVRPYRAFAELVLEDVAKVRSLPQGGGGMAVVIIPTWVPSEHVATIKQELSSQTFQWSFMGNSGFIVGIHRNHWL